MTFMQIFTGRLILLRTQRHLAQKYADHKANNFTCVEGRAAYFIVERALRQLETEFDSKKRNRSQTQRIRKQVA